MVIEGISDKGHWNVELTSEGHKPGKTGREGSDLESGRVCVWKSSKKASEAGNSLALGSKERQVQRRVETVIRG